MKILAGAGHPGGANAIIPTIKRLKDTGERVTKLVVYELTR